MRYDSLGSSGLLVSSLGIGCNAFGRRIDQDAATTVVQAALDEGVTFFDTADTYGIGESETMLGKALGARREEVVIATKFGMDMGETYPGARANRASRGYILRAVEGSLRRLGTDHIDLFQLHAPDRITPMAETLDALGDLVRSGKVRYIGCSNLAAWEVADAAHLADAVGAPSFITAQNEYSLYNRSAETELVPALEHFGMSLLPYFPLAYGLLTGKYSKTGGAPEGTRLATETARFDNARWDVIEGFRRLSEESGRSMLEIALGGLRAQPTVDTVIAGATRPEQVAANARAVAWEPTAQELDAIDAVAAPGSGPGHTTFAASRR
ncbi:aldo/keto reductase [Brachybacterium sp. AOP42-E1-35]|uniref:aldo/keto reductase n=1 Tax=Brachybacterium sp. AOP42-E1-35 TaxID=3457664 RepID=UPI00402A9F30